MKDNKVVLQALLCFVLVVSLTLPASVTGASPTEARVPDEHSTHHWTADNSDGFSTMSLNTPQGQVAPMVSAGYEYIVGLKTDGTLVAVGDNFAGKRNVGDWMEVIQVAAGSQHTVGLQTDGTAVAVGYNWNGQCNVGDWMDIIQVAAGGIVGDGHTVGLKADGSVVAVGSNGYGQCNVGGWTEVIQVAAGGHHTVGLRPNGTVIALGRNDDGQCDVGDWTDIVQVSAGIRHTVGLKANGTVVAVGHNYYNQCNVSTWTDIAQVAAGGHDTVGLTSSGTAVGTGSGGSSPQSYRLGGWTSIVQVSAGSGTIAGLRSDGSVVAVGLGDSGQCDVVGWTNVTQIEAGDYNTVGLRYDGTVIAIGYGYQAQYGVGDWTGIIQVAAGLGHTVGLKGEGMVVVAGSNEYGQCDIDGWTDIVQVAVGRDHTVGLRSDGTVTAVGRNSSGQCDVDDWTGIIQVAAGAHFTLGVKSDGTVECTGGTPDGQIVKGWTEIVRVSAAFGHTVGLKSDGTVVAAGWNSDGQCNVGAWTDIVDVAAGAYFTLGVKSNGTAVAVGDNEKGQCNISRWTDIVQVAAGWAHSVGLKSDGTVVAAGFNNYRQCNVGGWTDVTQVAAYGHTVGARADGTAIAVGSNSRGQCNVADWTNIIQVATGWDHTVGLKANGSLIAVGHNNQGQSNVDDWADIVQVVAGWDHTVGLGSDGTVVAVGRNEYGQCDVGGWTDIVQVAAGRAHTVGLKSDGTAVAVGYDSFGQCDVGTWIDIVQVGAGGYHTIGLKSDGTVGATGDWQSLLGGWTDIVQVAAGESHTVGVKTDGTAVGIGNNNYGQCDVATWTDIVQVAAGYRHTVGLKSDGSTVAAGLAVELAKWNLGESARPPIGSVTPMVATGLVHTVGLRSDGTVVGAGWNDYGQINVIDWGDIVQVAAGWYHTVGLVSDGTVVAVGYSDDGQCDISDWMDIAQVAAGGGHTVGLKSTGVVVAVGYSDDGQCDVSGWTDVVQVAAGDYHTVGLKANGSVVAVGYNYDGQCNVSGWTDIIEVAAAGHAPFHGGHTVGLRANGTVVAVGYNDDGQCDVSGWTDIVQVSAGASYTLGLRVDGTVVAAGSDWYGESNVGEWEDIVQVAAGYYHSVGLKEDCTVVAVGDNSAGQRDVDGWNLCEEEPPPGPFKFAIGDWVQTTANLNVREGPGLGYDVIKTMPLGATGQILAGPTVADGFFWWELEYTVGVRGWSVENWLELHETGAPVCIVKLQTDGAEIHEVGIWEFFDIYVGYCSSVTGIAQIRFSSDNVRDGYPTGRWTDWFDWNASRDDWDAETKIKRWAFDTPGYKEVWAQVKDGNGHTAFGLATILVPAPALPVLTSPMVISPAKDIYNVGDSLEAEFTIVNIGDVPITLDVLTVGGRLNGFIPPGGAPDFTFRSVTLLPNVPYEYNGALTLDQTGQYRFFIAYHLENPTQDEQKLLDENNWNTCIELGDGLLHTDRVRSIIVYEQDTVPDDVAQLRNLVDSLKGISPHIPPYLLSDESFGGSVATLWMYWKSFVTDSWDAYDMHYFAGLDYNYLRVKSLLLAEDALDLADLEQARRLVQMSIEYGQLSLLSFRGSFEVYDRNVEQAQAVARFVKDRCQAIVVAGVSVLNPAAGKALDYAFLCTDYLINRHLLGEEEAKKILIRDGVVKAFFDLAPIFDGKTLSDYVKAHPSFQLTQLRNYIVNSDTLPDMLYDVIRDLMVDESFEVVKGLAEMITQMLSSAIEYGVSQVFSPVELQVRDSQGRVTGLICGEVRHEIPGSMYRYGSVTVFFPSDQYQYQLTGTDEGVYGLSINRIVDGSMSGFAAIEIPTSQSAIHRYTVDWDGLAQGEDGITIEKDHDGDGVFDETIITGVPETPSSPSPSDRATEISPEAALSWTGDDSDSVSYNVYFGTTMELSLVSDGQMDEMYVPTMNPGTTYYWRIVAINEHGISSTSPVWTFTTQGSLIAGEVREANCDVLDGVTFSVYQDDDEMGRTVSDDGGVYSVGVVGLGVHTVVASKDGFRPQTRFIEVETQGQEYTLNFTGDHGPVPNAPSVFYVLRCVNLWLYGEPPCAITVFKVLEVVNAWLYPIDDDD